MDDEIKVTVIATGFDSQVQSMMPLPQPDAKRSLPAADRRYVMRAESSNGRKFGRSDLYRRKPTSLRSSDKFENPDSARLAGFVFGSELPKLGHVVSIRSVNDNPDNRVVPRVGITIGDAAGIGPEIVAQGLVDDEAP